MHIHITRNDNAAFKGENCEDCGEDCEKCDEVAHAEEVRILREVVVKILNGQESGICRDINGNRCGDWCV